MCVRAQNVCRRVEIVKKKKELERLLQTNQCTALQCTRSRLHYPLYNEVLVSRITSLSVQDKNVLNELDSYREVNIFIEGFPAENILQLEASTFLLVSIYEIPQQHVNVRFHVLPREEQRHVAHVSGRRH